jgi:hypothetical protein
MPQLHCLRDKCLTAFESYTLEAQKTCALLGELEDGPASLDRLFAILEQTQVEDQAQEAYLLLREQLFELLGNTEVR